MQLKSFRVRVFRNIVDSGPVTVDDVIVGRIDAGLLVYCSRTGERLGALGGADASVRSVDLAANLLASASADGTVRLWSAERMGEGEGGGPPPAAAEAAEAGA